MFNLYGGFIFELKYVKFVILPRINCNGTLLNVQCTKLGPKFCVQVFFLTSILPDDGGQPGCLGDVPRGVHQSR